MRGNRFAVSKGMRLSVFAPAHRELRSQKSCRGIRVDAQNVQKLISIH
jgi:hypothetical protein